MSRVLAKSRTLRPLLEICHDMRTSTPLKAIHSSAAAFLDTPRKSPAAQVYFRPGSNVVTPELSAQMAKGLGVQVEEVGSSDHGPKHLVFKGSNAYTAKSNAGGDAGSRAVFRQSHLKEAEHMGSFSSASIGQRTLKTMANLTQDLDTRDRNPMTRAAADMNDCLVSRYHATRTAAAGHEGGDSKEMLQKGIESIEQGLHMLKSSLQAGHDGATGSDFAPAGASQDHAQPSNDDSIAGKIDEDKPAGAKDLKDHIGGMSAS